MNLNGIISLNEISWASKRFPDKILPALRVALARDAWGILIRRCAMTCGIYKITNLKTGEFYVGKSIKIESRKSSHLHELKVGKHPSMAMQNAYNKLGSAYFSFEVLLVCERHELTKHEAEFIKELLPQYNTIMAGYAKSRVYIEPRMEGDKEKELVGLEKKFKPKIWHKWVYGSGRK